VESAAMEQWPGRVNGEGGRWEGGGTGSVDHFRNDGLKLDDRFWPDARYTWPAVTADLIGLVGGLPEGQGYLSLQQVETGEREAQEVAGQHFSLFTYEAAPLGQVTSGGSKEALGGGGTLLFGKKAQPGDLVT